MKIMLVLSLAIFILTLKVSAVSVVSDYLVNDTLELKSGESRIYSIRLQNPAEYEASLKLDYDKTFMKVVDYKDIYVLPPKTTSYKVLFNITAPNKPGLYSIGYTVSEIEPSGGGGVGILLKINKNFNLRVPNESGSYSDYYIAIFLYALMIATTLFLKKKIKSKKKSR